MADVWPTSPEMGKQDSSWRRMKISVCVVRCLVLVTVFGQCVGGKPMSETLQRALSAVRGPSPGAKKLLNIPEDGAFDAAVSNVANLLDGCEVLEPEIHGVGGYDAEPLELVTEAAAAAAAATTNTNPPATAGLDTVATFSAATAVVAAPEPSTSATIAPLTENLAACCDELDNAIIEILGEDPTILNTYGPEVHNDLAVRLEHFATHGLSKEIRKELTGKYLLPSNCKLINAPGLNEEIKAAISEITAKRDKSIELRQKQIAIAISCLSQAINKLIISNADSELVKLLMDSERILCDSQHNDSVIRRNFILSSLKKDMKDQLQNTKPDNLLFGQNLSETIKTARTICKSGAELKTPIPKPQTFHKKLPNNSNTQKTLNWKGPYPPRKQPYLPKMKEPPPNRNRPSSSSRRLQQQPTRGRR